MKFRFGDFVWFKGEGWLFCGLDEDGAYVLCRPVKNGCFGMVEFENVWLSDMEEYDEFLKKNGESLGMKYKRKVKDEIHGK